MRKYRTLSPGKSPLPILPHGPYVGLGLWNSSAELWIEGALYVAGIALYLCAARARDAVGRWGLWVLLVLMAAIWLSGLFSPPPTDVRMIAWGGLVVGWLIPSPVPVCSEKIYQYIRISVIL